MSALIDNRDAGRFEMTFEGGVAVADYRLDSNDLYVNRVFVPESLRGSGIASQIMAAVFNHAQAHGLKLIPVCSYAASWLQRHTRA